MTTGVAIVERARAHSGRLAIVADEGRFSYADLLAASERVAAFLLDGADDLRELRVAFLAPSSFHYVAVLWGVWRAGGIAVPLATSHPAAELEHVITDSDAGIVLVHDHLAERIERLPCVAGRRVARTAAALGAATGARLPAVEMGRRAMMVYTSGTTGKPKGVVLTHANLAAQVSSLVEAWAWRETDHILLVLPLHHVHGIVNVLLCALWSGACCEMMRDFGADRVWARFAGRELTLFMAVPTIYKKLISAWMVAKEDGQRSGADGCRAMRLMVSGSAALPIQTLERWRDISGHTLLERYGMTEIGMALSNPLEGERRPGFVGLPLPGVEVQLVDEAGKPVAPGTPGEIEVRGRAVFGEYWGRQEATAEVFRGGWFRTGDVGVMESGSIRLMGRTSVDIIKTGGFKVSALEIEAVLRDHPAIAECAVVGVFDAEWGERVCVAIEFEKGAHLTPDDLKEWAKERLATYKVPRAMLVVESLPRNAMGKVMKPEVARLFRRDSSL